MTTAQSPVDVLRTALERIRDDYGECWGGSRYDKATMDTVLMCMYCGEEHPTEYTAIVHDEDCAVTVARTALTEAAALAAEVPGRLSTDSTSVGNRISAAPPPAPVPGGMRDEVFREAARFLDVLEHHENSGGQQGVNIRYGITLAARHLRKYADRIAAATPPEVVVGMALKACKECGHSHWEHRREEPHACALCLCAAFDDVKTGGKLLASHPLVKPSPATLPVQQQGEAKTNAELLALYDAIGDKSKMTDAAKARHAELQAEAPTPPLGKCETCGGDGGLRKTEKFPAVKCIDCKGTGRRGAT